MDHILRDLDAVFEKIIVESGLREKIDQIKAEREVIFEDETN